MMYGQPLDSTPPPTTCIPFTFQRVVPDEDDKDNSGTGVNTFPTLRSLVSDLEVDTWLKNRKVREGGCRIRLKTRILTRRTFSHMRYLASIFVYVVVAIA